MSFANLLHVSYWFSQPLPAEHAVRLIFLSLFGVITLVGLVALVLRTRQREHTMVVVLGRVAALGITMGLIGFLLFSFRQEGIALFSWRLWPLVWLVGVAVWAVQIVRYVVSRVPQIKTEQMTRAMRERYLPKSSR